VKTGLKINKELDFNIDIRTAVQKLLLYKWYFAGSVIISMLLAWYISASTVPIYTVRAAILIKSNEKGQGSASMSQLLYGTEMLSSGKKIANEIALMQSTPFIKTILSRMDLNVIYDEGDNLMNQKFYATPLYKNNPFELILLDTNRNFAVYEVEFISEKAIKMSYYDYIQDINTEQILPIGDSVTFGRNRFMIKVADKHNFYTLKDRKFYITIHTAETMAGLFKGMLNAQQQSREASSIILLSLNSIIPNRDIDFLNQFMEEYVRYGLEDKTLEASKTIDFINKQLIVIRDSLERVESNLEKFKQKNSVSEEVNPAPVLYQQFIKFSEQRNNLLLVDRYYQYLEEYVKNYDDFSKDKIIVPAAVGIKDLGTIDNLLTKLIDLQIEKNTYLKSGATKNPLLKEVNTQIQQLKEALLENLNNLRKTNKITVQDAEISLSSVEKKLSTIPKSEREMVNIKRLFELNESVYLLLLQKKLEADIAKASAAADAKVLEPATCDGIPIAPKRRNNYLFGLIIGLVAPLIFVFVKEYLKSVIRNQEDIAKFSNIPIFGTVPHHTDKKATPMTIVEKPKSRISEAFRSLRSNLTFFTPPNAKNTTYLFTSSISGEGKSFCSASFALVLASMNKKTLFVLTDLRKPKFYIGEFDVTSSHQGLSTYLIGETTMEQTIQKTSVSNLDFIPPGALPPNPAELLNREAFSLLMQEAKQKYDYIVIDTAPIGLVSDAIGLLQYTDVVLYVVKQNHTPFVYISKIQEMFEENKIKNIGFLFNDVKMFSENYGYYGYGYYGGYGYYEEEKKSWWQWLNSKIWNRK
jgi:capsular exopolysaccharide synthesis family protein